MGKLYFIGAGPGDPELITVKGQRLIAEADVIIYAGSLVNPEILKYGRKEAEIYNSATMNLDEVLKVEIDALKAGKMVARVHTGDPAIYGAIQEQMDGLRAAGIKEDQFSVIPEHFSDRHHYPYGRPHTGPAEGKARASCRTSGDHVHFPLCPGDRSGHGDPERRRLSGRYPGR